ncbi:MAG TPA: hypothetical protein VIY53_11110 [Acidobacteriaceae bacterium]
MPVQSKPEDAPAAIRFQLNQREGSLEVTCAILPQQTSPPYSIEHGSVRFENRDAFKAAVVRAGMSPSVAEDEGRSFNATARQLRQLGFSIAMAKDKPEQQHKAA